MRISNKKQAYSLAEIMTVMLVLTVILAAFAPFMTKRRVAIRNADTPWVLANQQSYDAQTNPGNNTNRNQMFFGVTPKSGDDIESNYKPFAKLVIRSGPVSGGQVQRQIQFRYGLNNADSNFTDKGQFAGTWLMDGKNVLMGGGYNDILLGTNGSKNNTAIGYSALNKLTVTSGNTAIGYNALNNLSYSSIVMNIIKTYTDEQKKVFLSKNVAPVSKDNTAIGYNTGSSLILQKQNTYIGANAGSQQTGSNNTAVGYNAAGANSGSGTYNTYIGAFAGQNSQNAKNNVAVGTHALKSITSGYNNVALGYGALKNLTSGNYNVAIGYNACSEVTSGSYKTCIGANSGPRLGTKGVGNFIKGWEDNVQRTYIGSKPHNYGGDAVLELHNPDAPADLSSNGIVNYLAGTAANTTTIINGNLIVTGKTFFTSGQNLYHVHELSGTNSKYVFGASNTGDTCSTDPKSYALTGTNCKVFSTTSDRRLKNIGTRNESGLDKLSQLKVYNYTFKNDKNKLPHVGVMAQDLQKVFPNSVFTGEDGYLRIRWDEMFFATINAVKELDKKVIALLNRTFKVESQIAKLEKENVILKSQVDLLTARINKLKAQ